ncbi:hypothetical protein FACS1894153_2410 [Bacteroidia bacterium]|nr:hypothetical protein FACS1894153_2410 [Bacteroidia bacterium]
MSESFNIFREKYPLFVYKHYTANVSNEGIDISFEFEIPGLSVFFPTIKIPNRHFYNFSNLSTEHLNLIAFNIGLIELISYWKLTCSPKIIINPAIISDEQIQWWKNLYFNGLGEFFYINKIDTNYNDFVDISCNSNIILKKQHFILDDKVIVPIGGGKDSVVSLELIKDCNSFDDDKQANNCSTALENTLVPMIINPRGASLNCTKVAGFNEWDIIEVHRTISPALLELNKQGFLNGHTPFSAMLAFVSLLSAAISGHKHIALSNENSANEATDAISGANHQYSKSFQFEKDFRDYVKKYISEDFNYFSFLRPLRELDIAYLFSKYPQYHSVFRSCNAGSKQDIWCNNCAKCLFAFIILSPFIKFDDLVNIFGENLLDKNSLKKEFDELTGIADVKPFECVGTTNEVVEALNLFIKRNDCNADKNSTLIKYFKSTQLYNSHQKDYRFTFSNEHFLEQQFVKCFNKFAKINK